MCRGPPTSAVPSQPEASAMAHSIDAASERVARSQLVALMIAGFYLSFRGPSSLSVAMALLNAVSPKSDYLRTLDIEGNWPICGLPRALHTDNGSEFAHADAYRRGCANYDLEIVLRPPGAPRFGGHIERLIGTMMGRVHFLPGTTFSNSKERER